MHNPVAPELLKKVDRCDLMLITHGHFDHVYDALEIARATKPKIVTNFEIGAWLGSKGIDADSIIGINTGGTVDVDGIKVTLVHAEHSCGISDGDKIIYGRDATGLRRQREKRLPSSLPRPPHRLQATPTLSRPAE